MGDQGLFVNHEACNVSTLFFNHFIKIVEYLIAIMCNGLFCLVWTSELSILGEFVSKVDFGIICLLSTGPDDKVQTSLPFIELHQNYTCH